LQCLFYAGGTCCVSKVQKINECGRKWRKKIKSMERHNVKKPAYIPIVVYGKATRQNQKERGNYRIDLKKRKRRMGM